MKIMGIRTTNPQEGTCYDLYGQVEGDVEIVTESGSFFFHLQDMSCGGFGTRFVFEFMSSTIANTPNIEFNVWWGSMNDYTIDNEYAEQVFATLSEFFEADFRDIIYTALSMLFEEVGAED